MKKSEMQQLVEEFVINILGDYAPEELEEAAEQLRTIFNEYLDSSIELQKAIEA